MDSTDVGLYGTLRLVKRLNPHSVVASFPIDDDTVSFGRDPNCSVRLYYPTVSTLHAKIVFQEKKAFLVVLGTHGLLIDGCQVYPSTNTDINLSSSSLVKPNTIPLTNNSEIEIHTKRFIFTYPPKNARPSPIISTPTQPTQSAHTPARPPTSQGQGANTTQRTRTLRLSMIHSAQVFSPRPSADPAANLKILQTPLKAMQSRTRSVSPDKTGGAKGSLMERLWEARADAEMAGDAAGDGVEEDIVLVDGNHPRVVQEEKDLVILEDVPIPVASPATPTSNPTFKSTPRSQTARSLLNAFPVIPPHPSPNSKTQTSPPITLHLHGQQTQQTSPPLSQLPQLQSSSTSQSPRRLGPTKASLHKAVLIRSAQRAVMRAEAEAGVGIGAAAGVNVEMDTDVEMRSVEDEYGRELNGMGDEEDDEAEEREVAAFAVGGGTSESENEDGDERAEEDDREDDDEDNEERDREDDEDEEQEKPKSKSVWRKSWENLVGLVRSSSVTRDDEDQDQDREQDTHDASSDEEVEIEAQETHKTPHAQSNLQKYSKTYQRAVGLGGFMTPQAPPRGRGPGLGAGRYSVDGIRRATGIPTERETEREDGAFGGARRVRLETKWKVGDIVVPVEKDTAEYNKESHKTPLRGRVTEEERKAIQERRRSALKTPDTFFGGQAPGIRAAMVGSTPSKSATGGKAWASPYKGQHKIGRGNNNDNEGGKDGDGEDKEEDTQALLEKMKETVEGMKRRRSEVPGGRISAVDVRGGQDGGVDAGMNVDEAGEEDKEESDKENEVEGDAMVVHEDAHAPLNHQSSGPQTSSFNNIRERFQNPSSDRPVIAEPKTPKMDGVRDLFREKKVLATPAFEGVGEMMKTPRGWRMDVLEEGVEGDENGNEEEEVGTSTRRGKDTPASTSSSATKPPSSTTSTSTRRKTARSVAVKTPMTEGKSNFGDDEATPGDVLGRVEEEDEDKDKNKQGKGKGKKPVARKGRSKAPVVDSDVEEEGPGVEKVQKKARLIRGSKKVIDDIPEEVQEPGEKPKGSRSRKALSEENEVVVEATKPPTRKTKSAAKSKVAAITTNDEGSSSKPAHRTAKTADSGVSGNEDSVAPPAKLGRKTQTRTTKTQAAVSESEPEPFVQKVAPRKGRAGAKTTDDESAGTGTGTSKRGTRAKPAETEEDPLDSIDTPDESPVTVAVTKGRRVARSRTAIAENAKEEESEEETGGTGKKTSVRKGTKVTGKKAAVAASPATPELAESENGVDKENTPSVDDEDLPAKTKRSTKAKKGVKAAVVAETDGAVEVAVTKPRSTRTTRARK